MIKLILQSNLKIYPWSSMDGIILGYIFPIFPDLIISMHFSRKEKKLFRLVNY
jgi:hypothetical protein